MTQVFSSMMEIIFLTLAFGYAYGYESDKCLPYGPDAGDELAPHCDDCYQSVPFSNNYKFKFFGVPYPGCYIRTDGAIFFSQPVVKSFSKWPICERLGQEMVFPYWADANTNRRNGASGNVFYRQITDNEDNTLKDIFEKFNIYCKWALVVTWSEITFFNATAPTDGCAGTSATNTFQAILTSDQYGRYHVIYCYEDLTWTAGVNSGGDCNGLSHYPHSAKAGVESERAKIYTVTKDSCKPSIVNMASQCNINGLGKHVFPLYKPKCY